MKKLRFDKGSEAVARNAKAAEDRNCDMIDTNAWFAIEKDEMGFYLLVGDEDLNLLTEEEQSYLED